MKQEIRPTALQLAEGFYAIDKPMIRAPARFFDFHYPHATVPLVLKPEAHRWFKNKPYELSYVQGRKHVGMAALNHANQGERLWFYITTETLDDALMFKLTWG